MISLYNYLFYFNSISIATKIKTKINKLFKKSNIQYK